MTGCDAETCRSPPSHHDTNVVEHALTLLQLAVEYDGPEFLHEPLGLGFHKTDTLNDQQVKTLVDELTQSRYRRTKGTVKKPFTPLLLSVLLQRENPSGVDYINHVRFLRSLALVKRKRSRRNQRRLSAFLGIVLITLIMRYFHNSSNSFIQSLETLGYNGNNLTKPCNQLPVTSRALCRHRNARVWLKRYTFSLFDSSNLVCHVYACPSRPMMERPFRLSSSQLWKDHAPYALHTVVSQGFRKRKKMKPTLNNDPLRWLADSRLTQLIRPYIGKRERILDIGCGVGQLLYTLSTHPRNYTCLELSSAAVSIGSRLAKFHELGKFHTEVELRQQSLQDFFAERARSGEDEKFDAIVATESLSHQTWLSTNDIVEKLIDLLLPGGRLILVDDVLPSESVAATFYSIPGRQLLTHDNMTTSLQRNGLVLNRQRDLGLEFSLPELQPPKRYQMMDVHVHKSLQAFMALVYPFAQRTFPVAFQHILDWLQDMLDLQQADRVRAIGHVQGDLVYAMYIGTRPSQR